MINLNNVATPPADLPATLQTLSDLVSLLADPVAAKQRVADLQAATAAFRDAIEKSKTERASFDVAQAAHRKQLNAASAEQAARLAAAQTAFDAECARRKSELDQREAQIGQLQRTTKLHNEAAAATRADLDKRLAIIKTASG